MGYDGTLKFDTKVDSSGFETGVSKISSLAGGAIKTTSAIIGGAATALVGLGTAAVKVGTDFEASMSNVAAISGATGSELDALTAKAQEMGAKTKFSASESADAFSYMAMAGWKTEDMLNGIEGIMNLAAASGEDLAATSDIVTDALTAFGMSAQDSGHFADILAAASSNANTNVGLMGETFKYVAPVAGALGFSAEDTAQAIGLMANAGIKGSQAGTALRSVFTRLAKPTKQSAEAMDALGISLTTSSGEVKDLNTLLLEMREKFSTLTDAEKAQYAALLAGQEGMSGLLAIVNASDSDWNKLAGAIDGCTDELTGYSAAEEMAAKQIDNLQGQVTILKSALEGFGIKIYQEVDDPLKEVAKTANDMVGQLTSAFDSGGFDGLVSAFGNVLAQIVTEIANAAPQIIEMAASLVTSFVDSILNNGNQFAAAGVELATSLVSAVLSVSGDLWSAGIELFGKFLSGIAENSSEIGQVAAEAVIQLSNSIAENAPIIIQAGKDIVHGFLDGMSEEFPGISALLEGFFDGFVGSLEEIVKGAADIVGDIFSAINGADPETMRSVGEALGKIAAAMVTMSLVKTAAVNIQVAVSSISTLAKTAKSAVDVVRKFPEALSKLSSVGSAIEGFMSGVGGTVAGIAAVIGGAVLAVTNFFSMLKNGFSWLNEALMVIGIAIAAIGAVILGAPAAVAAAVAGIVAAVATIGVLIKEHWDEIVAWFQGAWESVKDFFGSLPEKLSTLVNNIFTAIGDFFSNVASSVGEFLSNLVSDIGTFLTELPYNIGYALGLAIGTIIKWGADVVSWVAENVPKIIDNIIDWFSKLPGRIWDWLKETYNKVVQWGKDTLEKAKQAAKDTIDGITNFFKELPGKIGQWLESTVQKVVSFGSELLRKGAEAAKNFYNGFIDIVKGLPQQMYDIGINIVNGVWNGIKSLASTLWNNVVNFFSGIVDGVKDALGIASPSKVFAKEVGAWIPPGVGKGMEDAMPGLLKDTRAQMKELSNEMQATVKAEAGEISFNKTGQQGYEQAQAERMRQSYVSVSGQLEGDRPIEVHTNLYLDKRKFAQEITPAVNHEMYKIDSSENNRGRGN